MDAKKPSSWNNSTTLARAILHDRGERRKWMFRMTLLPLGMLAVGLWVLDKWIWESPWRVLFAIYDALAVVREEREKVRSDVDRR
jgi:hypothetical protein